VLLKFGAFLFRLVYSPQFSSLRGIDSASFIPKFQKHASLVEILINKQERITEMTIKNLLISILFSGLFLQSTFSQNLDTVRVDNKQSILNDRAFFDFPSTATNIKRGVDIMSVDPNANEETRIIFDIGEMRLVFYAQELFAVGDENILTTVSKQNEIGGLKTKLFFNKDSLVSILLTPSKFDSTRNAILINSLIVQTQDKSLFRINAFINPKAYKLRTQFQSLTENVFKTLRKGTRKNNRKSRTEKLSIYNTDKAFIFNLPENYSVTIDNQDHFQVLKFHKYQSYADTNWIQLIVFAGHHPTMAFDEYGLDKSDAQKLKGTFLDKKLEWLFFEIKDKNVYIKEQKILSDIEENMFIHVAMLSNQLKLIDEMTKIIETARLTKK